MMAHTRRLERAGLLVFALVALVNGVNQWIAFQQLRSRMFGVVDKSLATEFVLVAGRGLARDAGTFLVGSMALVAVLALLRVTCDPRRLFAVLLLASAPMLIYALGVCVALLNGWQLDAWVLSMRGSTSKEVAATIQEAIPVVLQPLPIVRYAAMGLSAVLAGVLHARLCWTGFWQSGLVAASFLTLAMLAQMTH